MILHLDVDKVRDLAKASHGVCNGKGILGYDARTRRAIVCQCVIRALKAKGVNVRNAAEMQVAIGKEEGVKAC